MTTAEYWQHLPPFDHVVTYSFNRGLKLQEHLQAATRLIAATEQELSTARYLRQPALQQRLTELRRAGYRQDLPLTTPEGRLDPTASQVAHFSRADVTAEQLGAILSTPVQQSIAAGCRPVFRDALVFHDREERVVSVLNICFQCLYLQNQAGEFIEADIGVYNQLQELLTVLGHPINRLADARETNLSADFLAP